MPHDPVKLMIIVGARPNFVKVAPLFWEFGKNRKFDPILVHTGQHYDYGMSQIFFDDLDIPKPGYNLGIGSGNHGAQTGEMLAGLEKIIIQKHPAAVVVVGDVNSTLAGALAAAKLLIPVAHIEAGLRSYDKDMPEEVNRVLTDHISDLLFCPTAAAVKNLKKEGITKGVINTGDIMLDILKKKIGGRAPKIIGDLKIKPKEYLLLTVHRASNTDNVENFKKIIEALAEINEDVVFPMHPRTRKIIGQGQLLADINKLSHVHIVDPVSYLEMLLLEKNAKKIITDSGGVQKEAYWLGVPCVTLRDATEWTETLGGGWNIIVGTDRVKIVKAIRRPHPRAPRRDYYGNGTAAKKIIRSLFKLTA